MANEFSAEKLFEKAIGATIWIYLPFYAIYRLGRELIQEIFSNEAKK
jgi:hypothetical protein